jgi:HAD superfamily hydrolase (TIGR01509 family)
MIKAVLFDLWGTIIYNKSDKRPHEELLSILESAGAEDPLDLSERMVCARGFRDERQAAEFISKKVGCDADRVEEALRKYSDVEIKAYPDVRQNLEKVRGLYKTALVSNIGSFSLRMFLKTGMEKYFDFTFYSSQMGMIKQYPGFFGHVLKVMGLRPEEAVMVGDVKHVDIDPAERLGIRGILIRREGYPSHYIEKQTFKRTIRSLDEIWRFLKPPGPS